MAGPIVPDSLEAALGWRAWALARDQTGRPELRPIVYTGERWPARRAARAECPPHGNGWGHRPPEAGCTCGLYAVDRLERLPAVIGRDVTLIGSVALWGTLLEHEAGFRAEFAYPQRLRMVCGPCWELGAFGPKVVAVEPTSRGTLLALCAAHAGPTHERPGDVQDALLSRYAVERVPDETVNLIASVWSHPERRRRRGERFPRRAAFDAVMAVLFFGILLGAFVIAASLH